MRYITDKDFEYLLKKVETEVKDKTLESLDVKFSVYGKSLVVVTNGIRHDISKNIPDNIWEIGGEIKSPEDNWKIRTMLCMYVRSLVKELYPTADVDKIVM